MALQYGYGKIAGTESLVFAYDAGDMRNSYRGRPATNLLPVISYAYGEQNSDLFKMHYGSETVYIPKLGKTTADFCEIYNDYSGGSGACCVSAFAFGAAQGITPSTQYTYQIIYRTTSGYSNPNYMYHYEYSTSGYVTEYGLHSTSREEDLGDGWKMGWGTFTSNAATNNYFQCYLFHYEYAVYNKIQVAGIMLTKGTTIYRPHQFIPVNSSIPATGGLLDLTGNRVMDVSNVSFGTNSEIQFDGTDDYIDLADNPQYNEAFASWEFVARFDVIHPSQTGTYRQLYIQEGSIWIAQYQGTVGIDIALDSGSWFDGSGGQTTASHLGPVANNTWYHIVFTWNGTQVKGYLNGELKFTTNISGSTKIVNGTTPRKIGQRTGNPFQGQIPVIKLYRKTLTASEVAQNYHHYKSRYNI